MPDVLGCGVVNRCRLLCNLALVGECFSMTGSCARALGPRLVGCPLAWLKYIRLEVDTAVNAYGD